MVKLINRKELEDLRRRADRAEAVKTVLEKQREERDAECRSLQLRIWKLESELSSEKQKNALIELKVKDRL